jgi:hypothetical protein
VFPLREVNSKHHNDHISEAIATLQRNTINHRLHSKPQHRSCKSSYWSCPVLPPLLSTAKCVPLYLHSACTQRATLSLPIMDWTWATALRSSAVGRSSRVVQAARSVGRTRSSRSTLSVSLSVGVGVAEAVLAPGHRGRRCSRIWRSRSRGSAGAAVEIEVACPCQRGATRSATARWPFPSSLARRSGGRMAAGRGARWYACTGDLWECEYMCFGNSGMHLWLAFGSVGHGEVGRLST